MMATYNTEPTIQELITALKSGKYSKTTNILAKDVAGETPQYCCLGVLCELVLGKSNFDIQLKVVSRFPFFPSDVGVEVSWLNDSSAQVLANLNDNSITWNEVINILEKMDTIATANDKG